MKVIPNNKTVARICLICRSIHWVKAGYYGTLTKCGCFGNTGPASYEDILKHGDGKDLECWKKNNKVVEDGQADKCEKHKDCPWRGQPLSHSCCPLYPPAT